MNVLVLGSEGIIGSGLCKHLEKCGYSVRRWDIRLSLNHDLSNPVNIPALKRVIDASDFVFFLAYDVGGAKYISRVNMDFINRNMMIMLNTFNVLHNKKFIFASSTMYNMNNVYGTLKHMGEHYTQQLNGLSARFWNVYGSEVISQKSHVIPDMIHKWKTKGYIDLMTSGDEERQFIHTDECAKCLTEVMKHYEEIIETQTSIDITNFEWTTIKDVAKCICDDIRVTDITMTTHDRRNEPRDFVLKYWKPELSLMDGIKHVIDDTVDIIPPRPPNA